MKKFNILSSCIVGAAILITSNAYATTVSGTCSSHYIDGRLALSPYLSCNSAYGSSTVYMSDASGSWQIVPEGDGDGSADGSADADWPEDTADPGKYFSIDTEPTLTGHYGVAMAGGSWLADKVGSTQGYPSSDVNASSDDLDIPATATVVKAYLYYGGSIALPDGTGGGDYTPGDGLDSYQDVLDNDLTFSINGSTQTMAADHTSVGFGPALFHPYFGTLQGTATTYWANRIDVSNLITGDANLVVQPPNLDLDANTLSQNGGNDVGTATVNTCFGVGSWALVVIYEDETTIPETRQLTIKEGTLVAWDYVFAHKGVIDGVRHELRPEVTFDGHAPMAEGAEIYFLDQISSPSGYPTDNQNTCACGCGGKYTLSSSGYNRQAYFSDTHNDPVAFEAEYPQLNKDKNSGNGTWYLADGNSVTMAGNEYTTLTSGNTVTTFANLFEGDTAGEISSVLSDGVTPAPTTTSATASLSKVDAMLAAAATDSNLSSNYKQYPWAGLGNVEYLAAGVGMTGVKLTPDASRLTAGATSTTLSFMAEALDVFKPQNRINMSMMILSIPVDGDPVEPPAPADADNDGVEDSADNCPNTANADQADNDSDGIGNVCDATPDGEPPAANQAPVVTLNGDSTVYMTEGDTFTDPGATASDPEDGAVTVESYCDVNPNVANTYHCYYWAFDSEQAESETAIRTVIVEAAPPAATCEELSGYVDYAYGGTSLVAAGAAYGSSSWWSTNYYATGSGESLGSSAYTQKTVYTEDGGATYHVGSCP